MANVVVKNHVVDPDTRETYLRGAHEVSDEVAYSLTSNHPENVVYSDDLSGASKEELVQAATDAGVPVEEGDTKQDVAKKLGAKK